MKTTIVTAVVVAAAVIASSWAFDAHEATTAALRAAASARGDAGDWEARYRASRAELEETRVAARRAAVVDPVGPTQWVLDPPVPGARPVAPAPRAVSLERQLQQRWNAGLRAGEDLFRWEQLNKFPFPTIVGDPAKQFPVVLVRYVRTNSVWLLDSGAARLELVHEMHQPGRVEGKAQTFIGLVDAVSSTPQNGLLMNERGELAAFVRRAEEAPPPK